MKSLLASLTRLADRLRAELQAHWRLYLVWLAWAVAFILLSRAALGGPDGSRYLAYLRSLVFDRDLVLVSELETLGQRVISTASGYSAQIANVGILPFWAPWYLLGMIAAWLSGGVGSGLRSNYQLWLAFGDWIYGLLALIAAYGWIAGRTEKRMAAAAVLLAGLGTSFVYYMTALAPSYHMVTALVSVLYLRLWDGTRRRRGAVEWFGLGLLAGIAASIAQYHIVLLVFPALELLGHVAIAIREGGEVAGRLARAIRLAARSTPILPGLVLPLLPQMVVWWTVYGNAFANPYTMEADWSGARFLDVLFSSYHGLFFTAPVALLAVAGWVVGLRTDRTLYAGAILALAGIVYSSSTRIGWWGGVSFGMRYAVGLTPLFAAGLAVLMLKAPGRRGRLAVGAVAAISAVWTYGYFLQAFSGLTSFSEYHLARQWIEQQAVIVRGLLPILAAHWAMPRPGVLFTYLPGFLLVSLIVVRWAGARLVLGNREDFAGEFSPTLAFPGPARNAGQRREPAPFPRATAWRAILALAIVPLGFAGFLLTTIPNSEARIAELRTEGYFEQNRARGEYDWEQFANEYVERSRYWAAIGMPEAARADMARGMRLWQNQSRRLAAPSELATFTPLAVRFGTEMELLGYRLEPATVRGDTPLTVTLLWRADRRLPVDYDVGILLLNTRGEIVTRTGPARGVDPFPTSWWLPGEVIADELVLDTSKVEPATLLRVRAEVFDSEANRRLTAPANGVFAEVRAPPRPADGASVRGSVGEEIALISANVRTDHEAVTVELNWRAVGTPKGDFTVFVHLLDSAGQIVEQSDGKPNNGAYPTRAWQAGEVVVDRHRMALDTAKQALVARIVVGMYDGATGQRLPTKDGQNAITIYP